MSGGAARSWRECFNRSKTHALSAMTSSMERPPIRTLLIHFLQERGNGCCSIVNTLAKIDLVKVGERRQFGIVTKPNIICEFWMPSVGLVAVHGASSPAY